MIIVSASYCCVIHTQFILLVISSIYLTFFPFSDLYFLVLTFYDHSTMQVNSSGVMPIIFSTSTLALPGTLARFTGLSVLKKAAVALNPGGKYIGCL